MTKNIKTYTVYVDTGKFFKFRIWLAEKLLYVKYRVGE